MLHAIYKPGLLSVLFVSVFSFSFAQLNFNKDSLDEQLKRWLPGINDTTPGYSIGVISKGNVIYTNYKGSADLESSVSINESTVFNIGSVSKQFTAFLILQLEGEGKLSTEDLVAKYLSDYPVLSNYPVKISQLLHHTSGLREMLELLEIADGQNKYGYNTENIKYLIRKQEKLNFTPGQAFQYSNTNYFLLGQVIEKITGKPYPQYCREKIFTPLAMNDAFVMDNFKKVVPAKGQAYIKNAAGDFENNSPMDEFYGANGIHLTINDLLKWTANFMTRQVGDEQLFTKLTSKGKLYNGKMITYGYGLLIDTYQGMPTIAHDGARLGFRAEVLYLPTKNIAVVVLANLRSFPIIDIPQKIATYLVNEKPLTAAHAGIPVAAKPQVKQNKKNIHNFTGVYWSPEADLVRKVYVTKEELTYYRAPGNESGLAPVGDDLFYIMLGDSLTNNRLYFPSPKTSNREMVFINAAGDSTHYKQVDTVVATLINPAIYEGTFYCTEIDATVKMSQEDGQLVLILKGWPKMKLQMLFKDYFSNNEIGSFYFIRDKKNKISSVMYDSPRTRHLKYIKIL